MSIARYLIDTSGLFRIFKRGVREIWEEQLSSGVVALCPIVELEFLYSARSLADRLDKQGLLGETFSWTPMAERAHERAAEVQQLLTERGQRRSAGAVDLLIAATAERAGLIVLTDDNDYDTIASVTGQPVTKVTPPPRPNGDA